MIIEEGRRRVSAAHDVSLFTILATALNADVDMKIRRENFGTTRHDEL